MRTEYVPRTVFPPVTAKRHHVGRSCGDGSRAIEVRMLACQAHQRALNSALNKIKPSSLLEAENRLTQGSTDAQVLWGNKLQSLTCV